MKNMIMKMEKEENHRKKVERNMRHWKKVKDLERKMQEQKALNENTTAMYAHKKQKTEEQLREEVRFASVDQLKLNPENLNLLQDEILLLDKTKSRDIVAK